MLFSFLRIESLATEEQRFVVPSSKVNALSWLEINRSILSTPWRVSEIFCYYLFVILVCSTSFALVGTPSSVRYTAIEAG